MNTLYMKIHEFDEASGSLIVSFASDATKSQDPDQYGRFAFQPTTMWPDISEPEEIKKRIAIAGVWHVEQQARDEALRDNIEALDKYRALVGAQVSYAIADLTTPSDEIIPHVEV